METQSVLIPRDKFSLGKAKEWLISNKFKLKKLDITSDFFRFRQQAPSRYKSYRMKTLPNGVKLVLGVRN